MLAYPEWGVVTVTGPDARSFLQSLLSQDIDPLADGDGAHALLLQPQGKLLADVRVLRVDADTWWCICEASVAPALAEGLNRFKIRVKVDVVDASSGFTAIALRGDLIRVPVDVPAAAHAHVEADGVRWVRNDWLDTPGVDGFGDPDAIADVVAELGIEPVAAGAFERARVLAGVARQGLDTDERTIPQEAFLELDAVSFTKGCFVGQELVCRIDTRGHVNRYLRRLRLDAPAPAGAALELDGKPVGEITSPAGDVALAMVRREVDPPAEVDVVWDAGRTRARVEALAPAT